MQADDERRGRRDDGEDEVTIGVIAAGARCPRPRASTSSRVADACGLVLALALGAGVAGCGHTHTVEPTERVEGPREKPPSSGASTSAPDARASTRHARAPSDARAVTDSASGIRLASSPAGLLKSGAARKLQDRLIKHGDLKGAPTGVLDPRTRDALARFQGASDLPATGVPDDATVRKLGLDPRDVFDR